MILQLINEAANVLKITDEMYRQARGNGMHFVVEFPVKEFLLMSTENEKSLETIQKQCRTIDDYNRWAEEGETILMPFLSVDADSGKITGHEGRHRATAIMCSGAKTMPVSIRLIPNEAMKEKYGVFEAKYAGLFEDLPDTIVGQFGRGSISKSNLNLLKDGNPNLK